MDLAFTVHNPKPIPYTISKIGYTVSMNDVTVGAGETTRSHVVSSGKTETIDARATIENENLDDWWVTHLQRNQYTQLRIDFYMVLEGGGTQIRIPLDAVDYEKEIETDIFGNKDEYPTGTESSQSESGTDGSDGDESESATPTQTDDGLLDTGTDTQTATDTDDGLLDGGETAGSTPTPTPTATRTESDDGLLSL
jgi:hypothetical protein